MLVRDTIGDTTRKKGEGILSPPLVTRSHGVAAGPRGPGAA
ncbi:hypothetical protein HMPREF1868_00410 [Olsenella sp. DNF00959]|nr:hypothetical protein HMPREF1868_00410 [Olsenella sp. DNF00959]